MSDKSNASGSSKKVKGMPVNPRKRSVPEGRPPKEKKLSK